MVRSEVKPARSAAGVTPWKTVAWNGVRFEVPGDWEPARIGRRHLLLASEPGPVMEIKWAAVKGRFFGRRPLRELSRRVGRQGGAFQETALSEDWRASVSGFDAEGFQWDAGNERGAGVLLRCAACRTVSLVQFRAQPGADLIARHAARVLGSFRDHRSDHRVAWALYDVRALLPDHFVLGRHRFEAGRFVLQFNGRGRLLTLYRWAPAEVLLQNRSLAEFAATIAGGTLPAVRSLIFAGHPAVEACDPEPAGPGERLRMRLGMSWFRQLRMWRVTERNRILGVRLEGRRPVADPEMRLVCDGYGMADEKPPGSDADPP